eukprot:TRINITY_DN11484_c0_g1_i3.p1 TRINITY_DN11484_c0_g1~~TRINITY_DN11484_c0_g1_i3.p1  ORF type:complete len:194 (-),score=39.89 TRINITY_DN11484_c0_g1_i3:253-834(-)
MEAPPLTEDDFNEVYDWVDSVQLSRPKRIIARDFADGVLMAEIVSHYYPKLVELHNYIPSGSITVKRTNWNLLNQKVFHRLGFELAPVDIEHVINCAPNAIERVLRVVKIKIDRIRSLTSKSAILPPINRRNPSLVKSLDGKNVGTMSSNENVRYKGNPLLLPPVKQAIAEKDQTIKELYDTIQVLYQGINVK